MLNIVLPTDFSENAMNALRYTSALLNNEKSHVSILHAYDTRVDQTKTQAGKFDNGKESIKPEIRYKLAKIEKKIRAFSQNPAHVYESLAAPGILIDEVKDLTDGQNMDLVVMGTRGETNDREMTFGSNTLQVLKNIKAPVLTIPEAFTYSEPREILFVTDFMLPYSVRELKLFGCLAKSFAGPIHLLYVTDYEGLSHRQQRNRSALEAVLGTHTLLMHNKKGSNVTKATSAFLEEHDIDLLVMVRTQRSYLDGLFHKSSVDALGLHLKTPFLILQNLNRS